MNFRVVQIALWALAIVVVGWWGYQKFNPSSQTVPINASAPMGISNPTLTLVDGAGEVVSTSELKNGHQLLYFGYTFCPDVCPISARKMLTADALYQLAGGETPLRSIFITVDPQRDTPDIMKIYAENLSADVESDFSSEERSEMSLRLIGLTGSQSQIDEAVNRYRVIARKDPNPEASDAYLISHTDLIYWVNPAGEVRFFSPLQSADMIARTLLEAT